jgi:hypothetical protein
MRELRSYLGGHQPKRIEAEAKSGPAGVSTASWSSPSKIRASPGELIRQLGVKLYGERPEVSR